MRRTTTGLIHTLKDQVRGVRYSLRAEAKQPGSVLPKAIRESDIGPLITMGAAMGTPALRLADGLFTQVEQIATGMFADPAAAEAFPFPAHSLLRADGTLANRLYEPTKLLARRHGVSDVLVSEHALDRAAHQLRARFGDVIPAAGLTSEHRALLVQVCAGLACALDAAKPIRKVAFADREPVRPHFMLSPNLYCAFVIGLSTALASLNPDLAGEPDTILDSADSAVDARFDRMKRATVGKTPIDDLAREFEALLPFLP